MESPVMKRPDALVGHVINPLSLISAALSPANVSPQFVGNALGNVPMPVMLLILPERFLGNFGMLLRDRVMFMMGANEAMKRSVNSLLNNPNLGAEVQKLEKGKVLASVFSPVFREQFNTGVLLEVAPAQMMLAYAIADQRAFAKVGHEALQQSLDGLFTQRAMGSWSAKSSSPDSIAPVFDAKSEAAMTQLISVGVLYRSLLDVSVSRDSFSFGARVRASKAKKEVLELLMSESRRRKLPAKSAKALASLFARVAKRIFK